LTYLGFVTEGKLVAIFIKPSLGVFNWPVIYIINYTPTSSLALFNTAPSVRSMETAEMAMETDGDGSGGTSPSRQGAGIETSIPRNSSSAAAELRNSSRNFADSSRVFCREALYRRRGDVRRWARWPHHQGAWPGGGPRHPMVWLSSGPPPALVRSSSSIHEK
jgi:hypothetical protein